MSGGSFDYAFRRVEDFVAELGEYIRDVDYVDNWKGKPYFFEPATLEVIKKIHKDAAVMAKLMKEVEWLYSGDNGDESFMRNVAKIQGEP